MQYEIENPPRRVIEHYRNGDTPDIMQVIMEVVNQDELKNQVQVFARQYRATDQEQQIEQLRQLWQTCRSEIRYKEDRPGLQAVKHPARIWAEKEGDCKSLTVFIYHCCRAIGIPCFIRFASYDTSKQIGHVYPVAVVGGRPVVVDAVWHRFNDEKKPTHFENHLPAVFANDKQMRHIVATAAARPSAIGSIQSGWQGLSKRQKALAAIVGSLVLYRLANA